MRTRFLRSLLFSLSLLFTVPSCIVTDGSHAYRKKNKCCGIIKCDLHRRSARKKHKHVTEGHRKLRKKEERIKRGWKK